jgi:2-polyprenyl-3-methyl-5-hydroxy-6-metoxy-1,4-benzoquinol methylase
MAERTRDVIIRDYVRFKHGRNPGLDEASQRMIFRAFQRSVGPWLPAHQSAPILDVGCGEGAFLAFLASRGYTDLAGFDLSEANVELCRSRGLVFVERLDALNVSNFAQPKTWQLIACLDVIEHLPKDSAVAFVADLRDRLTPGGSLLVQTLNMASPLGLYHRHHDLTHEWGLTEGAALDLFTAAGFDESAVTIVPAWNATKPSGYVREIYVSLLHRLIYLSENAPRPRIPTKNLLIHGTRA